jgi:hypothetical protein
MRAAFRAVPGPDEVTARGRANGAFRREGKEACDEGAPVFLLAAGERRGNPSNQTAPDTPSSGRRAPGDRLWKQAE